MPPEQAPEGGAEDEAEPEGDPHEAVVAGAGLRGRHVGDVGVGGGDAGPHDPGDGAANEEPADGRREALHEVVDAEPEQRAEDDRPPAEAVGEGAQDGGAQELHQGVEGDDDAVVEPCPRVVAGRELPDELGQDGDDDAQPEDVDEQGDEDEDHPRLSGGSSECHLVPWGAAVRRSPARVTRGPNPQYVTSARPRDSSVLIRGDSGQPGERRTAGHRPLKRRAASRRWRAAGSASLRPAVEVAGRQCVPAGADTGTADLTAPAAIAGRVRCAPGHSAAGRGVDSSFTMETLAHP